MILFDVPAISGEIGAALAVGFFLVFAALAFIVFKMIKRTVKMAVRMAIVAVILLIAVVGGASLLYFNSGNGGSKPPIQQKR
jgi:hypothetical protein